MIIVADRMAREVLSGRRHPTLGDQPVATTWGFHYRLLTTLSDKRVDAVHPIRVPAGITSPLGTGTWWQARSVNVFPPQPLRSSPTTVGE